MVSRLSQRPPRPSNVLGERSRRRRQRPDAGGHSDALAVERPRRRKPRVCLLRDRRASTVTFGLDGWRVLPRASGDLPHRAAQARRHFAGSRQGADADEPPGEAKRTHRPGATTVPSREVVAVAHSACIALREWLPTAAGKSTSAGAGRRRASRAWPSGDPRGASAARLAAPVGGPGANSDAHAASLTCPPRSRSAAAPKHYWSRERPSHRAVPS